MVLSSTDAGRVRTLTFERPDALNAMNNELFSAFRDALDEAASSPEVAVVVVTGRGRGFCAGQDLTEMLDTSHDSHVEHQFLSMLPRLATFPKPLIAAVNGLGVGIGMTMLAHCDLVFMSTDARLRTPFPQLGLAPEAGSSSTFAGVMGWQNAAYVLMSGRWFEAQECLDMGLVWRVCPPESLLDDAMAVATELAANPIPSLVATKQLMLDSGRAEQALAAHKRELIAYQPLMGGAANREAVAAFSEKREPNFGSIPGL